MKSFLLSLMLVVGVGLFVQPAAAEANGATVVFLAIPDGSTITYLKDGVTVTETLEIGREYPADSSVKFGSRGFARVKVLGHAGVAVITGDNNATFDLANSSVVDGIVVNVPEGGSNVQVQIGGGTPQTVGAGSASSYFAEETSDAGTGSGPFRNDSVRIPTENPTPPPPAPPLDEEEEEEDEPEETITPDPPNDYVPPIQEIPIEVDQ